MVFQRLPRPALDPVSHALKYGDHAVVEVGDGHVILEEPKRNVYDDMLDDSMRKCQILRNNLDNYIDHVRESESPTKSNGHVANGSVASQKT